MEDECFAGFMNDNDFLKRSLPISEGVNDILKDIFVLNPARRLTLADMRSRIVALDTFFTLRSNSTVKEEIRSGDSGPHQSNGDAKDFQISNVSVFKAGTSERQPHVFVSDPDACHKPIHVRGQPDPSLASNDALKSLAVPFSGSSGSSGPESKGPITPTTRAVDVDPPVDIPDISSAVLGDVVGLEDSFGCKPAEVAANAKARRPADIFRAAVQRIKILSKTQ
jgi:hypothetical protein